MNQGINRITLVLMVILLVLTSFACNSKPEINGDDQPYPPEGEETIQPEPHSLAYPDLEDGELIQWAQAVSLIMSGEVNQVFQTHAMTVTLMLKDGRSFVTVEPNLDQVFDIVEKCGEPCKDMELATE